MNNRQKGTIGEDLAVAYLKNKDYEILTRNYYTRAGEIDIVAAGHGYLVFVEVKLRKNDEAGLGAEAVNRCKIKKIVYTASQYIEKYRLFDQQVRFDVIEIYTQSGEINHIENAFESCLNL